MVGIDHFDTKLFQKSKNYLLFMQNYMKIS